MFDQVLDVIESISFTVLPRRHHVYRKSLYKGEIMIDKGIVEAFFKPILTKYVERLLINRRAIWFMAVGVVLIWRTFAIPHGPRKLLDGVLQTFQVTNQYKFAVVPFVLLLVGLYMLLRYSHKRYLQNYKNLNLMEKPRTTKSGEPIEVSLRWKFVPVERAYQYVLSIKNNTEKDLEELKGYLAFLSYGVERHEVHVEKFEIEHLSPGYTRDIKFLCRVQTDNYAIVIRSSYPAIGVFPNTRLDFNRFYRTYSHVLRPYKPIWGYDSVLFWETLRQIWVMFRYYTRPHRFPPTLWEYCKVSFRVLTIAMFLGWVGYAWGKGLLLWTKDLSLIWWEFILSLI